MKQPKLPVVKFSKFRDVKSCAVDLETDDDTMKLIENYGRKVATPTDYVRLGLVRMLENTVKSNKQSRICRSK